jgi:hypothetical protein
MTTPKTTRRGVLEKIDTTTIAWTEPTNRRAQKARRVHVWLKHSIHNLASPSTVEFDDDDNHHHHNNSAFRDSSRKLDRRSMSSSSLGTTTSSSVSTSVITSRKTTTTIDQAMFSLHTCVGPKTNTSSSAIVVAPEAPSSYLPAHEHDWMLDGTKNERNEQQDEQQTNIKSQDYLTYLNTPWDMETYLTNYLQEWEDKYQQELKQEEAAFSFQATFEELDDQQEDPKEVTPDDDLELPSPDSDDFGDFQQAMMMMTQAIDNKNNKDGDTLFDTSYPDNNDTMLSIDQDSYIQSTVEEGEENSQEEQMVQEAVTILKSLPTDEFNKTFYLTKEPNEVLEETCELATQLEHEKDLGDEASPTRKTVSNIYQAESKQDVAIDPSSSHPSVAESSLTSSETENNNSKATGDESLEGQGESLSLVIIGQINATESHKIICVEAVDSNDERVSAMVPPIEQASQTDAITSEGAFVVQAPEPRADNDEVESSGDFCEIGSDQETSQSDQVLDEDPNETDSVDFGNFQDATTRKVGPSKSKLEVVPSQVIAGNVKQISTVESPRTVETKAPAATATARLSFSSQEAVVDSAFRPTFAVLPPLKVDTVIQAQQQAEDALRQIVSRESQHPVPPSIERNDNLFEQANYAEDREDISLDLDEGDDAMAEDIPISWRLPISDLSTPLARFARRQRQNYKETVKTKKLDGTYPQSTSSLFSVLAKVDDEDEDGEPPLTLADLDLPSYYTQAELDDTTRVLQNAPWHHIEHVWGHQYGPTELQVSSSYSFEDQQDRRALWDQYFTQELCQLDSAQNEVAKMLLRHIQPHEAALERANRSIHQFASNLQIAQLYLKRSQAYLGQAARGAYDQGMDAFVDGEGWFGAFELLQAWDERDLYVSLDSTLKSIEGTLRAEQRLLEDIASFTFQPERPHMHSTITRRINQLKQNVLNNESLSRIAALDELRCRLARSEMLHSFHNRLHILAESVAVRCCRRRTLGLSTEYKNLLEGVLEVDFILRQADKIHQGEISTVQCGTQVDNATMSSRHYLLQASWPQTIMEALCFEANRAFAAALLDPFTVSDEGDGTSTVDSEFERELTQLGYEIQQGWGDGAKLRTIAHNLVIIRFDWEKSCNYILPVYHRICCVLSDVLYAHHVFAQWHERLVNELTETCTTATGESKEEKTETTDNECSPEKLDVNTRGPAATQIVEKIRLEWIKARVTLWKRCEAVLVQCLDEYLHFGAHVNFFDEPSRESVKNSSAEQKRNKSSGDARWRKNLEEMRSLLELTEQFLSLKSQFLGGEIHDGFDDSSSQVSGDLKERLCDVFRKHLRFVHVEAMNSLGASLSQEKWEMVPLKQLSDYEKAASFSHAAEQKVPLKKVLSVCWRSLHRRIQTSPVFLLPFATNSCLLEPCWICQTLSMQRQLKME